MSHRILRLPEDESTNTLATMSTDRQSDDCSMALDRAAEFLEKAKTIQQTKLVVDIATMADQWARQHRLSKKCIKRAKSILTYAQHKLGQQLLKSRRNTGARGIGPIAVVRSDSNSPPTLAELGISRDLSSKCQKLARLSKAQVDAIARGEQPTDGEGTVKQRRRRFRHLTAKRALTNELPLKCRLMNVANDITKALRDDDIPAIKQQVAVLKEIACVLESHDAIIRQASHNDKLLNQAIRIFSARGKRPPKFIRERLEATLDCKTLDRVLKRFSVKEKGCA